MREFKQALDTMQRLDMEEAWLGLEGDRILVFRSAPTEPSELDLWLTEQELQTAIRWLQEQGIDNQSVAKAWFSIKNFQKK